MTGGIELAEGLRATRLALKEIPAIDFGPFRTGDPSARKAVATAIGTACHDIGFFYLAGHGVPDALVARTFAEARRFFELPLERKLAIDIEASPCHRGYFRVGGENLDPAKQTAGGDFKEGVKIGREFGADHPLVKAGTPLHGANRWPQDLPGWQAAMQAYFDAMDALGRQIMHAFALALGLEERFFDRFLTDPMATLGPLRYPPQRGGISESRLGAGAHSDYGCLTILAQDGRGGLQVRNAAGAWIDATPIAGTFVINIGDMMARWTNNHFASTRHRVINTSGADRYSLPFFFDPSFHTPVAALPTCTGPDRPPVLPPTTSGQHLLDKINASFDYHRTKDEHRTKDGQPERKTEP